MIFLSARSYIRTSFTGRWDSPARWDELVSVHELVAVTTTSEGVGIGVGPVDFWPTDFLTVIRTVSISLAAFCLGQFLPIRHCSQLIYLTLYALAFLPLIAKVIGYDMYIYIFTL